MNKEDMIRLAHEAGWKYADGDDGYAPLWEFGQLVEAAECEVCAKLVEDSTHMNRNGVAKAIRARGQHD